MIIKHIPPVGGMTAPRSINLVALGPSQAAYHQAHAQYDPVVPSVDQTWTVNKGFRTIPADLVFILDDMVGEKRRSQRYYDDILKLEKPIITSIHDYEVNLLYPRIKIHEFPIFHIIDFYGRCYLMQRQLLLTGSLPSEEPTSEQIRTAGRRVASWQKNSIPMILAYAGAIGVQTINCFGVDYDYPGNAAKEAGKDNFSYWVGVLQQGLGVEFFFPATSTALDVNQGRDLYGYGARQPEL